MIFSRTRCLMVALFCLLPLVLASCGGGGSGANPANPAAPRVVTAAMLATQMGRPSRLLLGLGSAGTADIQAQGLTPDIYDQYLVGVGAGDWTTWNAPAGAYVNVVAASAESVGAVPMLTMYQMAGRGDGNMTVLSDPVFMTQYWANVVLMFQRLGIYNKPALVNFEPDFWGYVERASPNADPAQLLAYVNVTADCSALPNHAGSVAACVMLLARKYAPKVMVGIPPSSWGGNTTADVVAFMNKAGANQADFVVMQTSDRDAGCFELQTVAECVRVGSGWYWDETNLTHPNFQDHLQQALAFHQGIGGLPLIWWQTPLGVPSATPGGTSGQWRDNRVQYFLTHPAELTAVGGLGVVFSPGGSTQTTILTDGGQFQRLSQAYYASPAALP